MTGSVFSSEEEPPHRMENRRGSDTSTLTSVRSRASTSVIIEEEHPVGDLAADVHLSEIVTISENHSLLTPTETETEDEHLPDLHHFDIEPSLSTEPEETAKKYGIGTPMKWSRRARLRDPDESSFAEFPEPEKRTRKSNLNFKFLPVVLNDIYKEYLHSFLYLIQLISYIYSLSLVDFRKRIQGTELGVGRLLLICKLG